MKYRAEIDGLRALAVMPVILFHAGFDWFSGGFVGVDVFFVISGYLITTIIIAEMDEGKFSLINFYDRRARRILPALFFVTLICIPFAWLWFAPNDLRNFGQSLVAVSTFSSNILFWLESGYFDTHAEMKPLLHTWSLAVEEQYYILFPIFLMLTWRLGLTFIIAILSIFFVVSLVLADWSTQYASDPSIISGAFFLLPTRGWELLIGVFIAFYLKYRNTSASIYTNQILSLFGFLLICYSILSFDKNTPFPSYYALIPTIGTGLIILFTSSETLIYRLLSLRIFVGIGLISYSSYLWHQPLFAFAKHLTLNQTSDFLFLMLIALSILLAWLTWRFIEKPFRNKKLFTKKFIMITSAASMTVVSLIGLSFHFKYITNELTFDRGEYGAQRRGAVSSTRLVDVNDERSAMKRYAIVGDSMWIDAVNILDFAGQFEFTPYQAGGCPPNNEYIKYKKSKHCINLNKIRFSEDFSNFDGVVVIGRYSDRESSYLDPFLKYLNDTGVENVLVFGPYIGLKDQSHFLDRLILRAGGEIEVENFIYSKKLLREKNFEDMGLSNLVSTYGYSYISMYESFCEISYCPIYIDGIPFTYDVHHFTLEFSEMTAKRNDVILKEFLTAGSK
ncbi:acyltransferase [Gammaproteobacteria bacterium]|nr:acyltransferase [Gammaproteobacteria bacterium]